MTQFTEKTLGLADPEPTSDEPTASVAVQAQEAQELARQSLDFLAALALPTVFRYLFPPVFKAIWQFLLSYVS